MNKMISAAQPTLGPGPVLVLADTKLFVLLLADAVEVVDVLDESTTVVDADESVLGGMAMLDVGDVMLEVMAVLETEELVDRLEVLATVARVAAAMGND